MNIDERFEKLEKQNETFAGQIKTLKKMLGGVAALALAALIGGTALGVHAARSKTFDTLTAKTLFLRNSNNKKTVQIMGSNGTLYLYNSSGTSKIILSGSDGKLTRVSETSW